MWPPQGSVEGGENLPCPAAHTLLNAPQDRIGFLGSQGTLLAHGQAIIHQSLWAMAHKSGFRGCCGLGGSAGFAGGWLAHGERLVSWCDGGLWPPSRPAARPGRV